MERRKHIEIAEHRKTGDPIDSPAARQILED
jgi:hypothetical protein